MSTLNEFRQMHSELVALTERLGRALDAVERKAAEKLAEAGLPVEVAYDRERLPAPPTPVQPASLREEPGEYLELEVESLHVTHDGEKKTFKVKGGAYRKWGVFIWPEVLQGIFNINPDELEPGLYGFKHRVRILMDGDKPRKVVGLA